MALEKGFVEGLNIGLLLLSADYRVIGMNATAHDTLRLSKAELGKSVLNYHAAKSQERVTSLLKQAHREHSGAPAAMIIDVLNKVLMISVSPLEMMDSSSETFLISAFLDVTAQTGAAVNPMSGKVELKKFPIYDRGNLLFLDSETIYFFAADKNYCRVVSEAGRYYIQLTLKEILQRYAGTSFARAHKSYVVNLRRVRGIKHEHGHYEIVFDSDRIQNVPVARRRLQDLKAALGLI
jgi:DNA-binding LytR/AlgR family response regulator